MKLLYIGLALLILAASAILTQDYYHYFEAVRDHDKQVQLSESKIKSIQQDLAVMHRDNDTCQHLRDNPNTLSEAYAMECRSK